MAHELERYELEEIHDYLIELAREAGKMITSAKPSTSATDTKKNSVDLVTETDQAVERKISTKLKEKYMTFEFIGEETYKPGTRLSAKPTFIVDPIDGTTNFVHGHPYVSISLGLAVNLEPVVGVVYNPFTDVLYSAVKGQGAYMTTPSISDSHHEFASSRTRLPLKNPPDSLKGLSSLQCCVEWGSDRSGNDFDVKSNTFRKLAGAKETGGAMVHSLRSYGSAALNLCGVAAGHLDLYWEAGCWAWDVCAGWAILKEAGGIVVDANPGNWHPIIEERRYLAVRAGEGQKAIVEEFWSNVVGKFEVGI